MSRQFSKYKRSVVSIIGINVPDLLNEKGNDGLDRIAEFNFNKALGRSS
jgi:hypothetical protein